MKMITIIAILFILPGCMIDPPVNWNIPSETETRIQIENDDFKKMITYRGPNIEDSDPEKLFIRAWRKYGSPHINYQIYIADCYSDIADLYGGDWRFYDSAYDDKGNNLDVILISRDVDCHEHRCSFEEHVGVNIDRLYLEKSKESGIRVKLYGKTGQEIFFIPGGYVQGFLAKIDSSVADQ